jgi:4-O-beta-D-mannosyl-D-glucose phosphorylase
MNDLFRQRYDALNKDHDDLLERKNVPILLSNGVFERYKYPILTAQHTPLFWRYDLDRNRNPYLMQRFGINGTFNAKINIF